AVIIDRLTPGGVNITSGEWGIGAQMITFGAEVIVDHIQKDAEALCMSGVDEGLHVLRTPISAVRRKQAGAVVAPVPATRKVRNGHQLYRIDTERLEVVQPFYGGDKRALGRECADVQFV